MNQLNQFSSNRICQNNGFNRNNGQSFNPSNPQTMSNNFSNVEHAFAQNKPLINAPDFTNQQNVLHNNLGNNLLEQQITEYKIHVDSTNRDTGTFPSPFNFKIPFGSSSSFGISKNFSKVKYVTMDHLILPKNIAIDISRVTESPVQLYPTGSTYSSSPVSSTNILTSLSSNRYIIVKIDELENSEHLGTSILSDEKTFKFIYDKNAGLDNQVWKPMHGSVVYPSSNLFNFSRLSISLYDQFGNALKLVDENGNNIVGTNITGLSQDYVSFVSDNSSVNSVNYTNNVTQIALSMTIGVVENRLNTNNYK